MQQIENMKEFCIQENDSDQRLDRFLQKTLPELPKSLCYQGEPETLYTGSASGDW